MPPKAFGHRIPQWPFRERLVGRAIAEKGAAIELGGSQIMDDLSLIGARQAVLEYPIVVRAVVVREKLRPARIVLRRHPDAER